MKNPGLQARLERYDRMARKARIVEVSTDFLVYWFSRGEFPPCGVENPLPEDARIVDCQMSFERPGIILLKVESESFDSIPKGQPISSFGDITFHSAEPIA